MDCLIRINISSNDKKRKFKDKVLKCPRRSHKNKHWHSHCQKVIKDNNLEGLKYSEIASIAKETYEPLPKENKPEKKYIYPPEKRDAWLDYFEKHKNDKIYKNLRYNEKYYQLKKIFNNIYVPKTLDPDELADYSPNTETSSEDVDDDENPTLLRFYK